MENGTPVSPFAKNSGFPTFSNRSGFPVTLIGRGEKAFELARADCVGG